MPEHVHVIVHPLTRVYSIAAIRKGIKQPVAGAMLGLIRESAPEEASRLICAVRNGKPQFRFWQKGKGYDSEPVLGNCDRLRNFLHPRQPCATASERD
ncbi:MAG: hypothetical protein ACR2HJ_05210 [Fimbriimonadales bacterium]